DVCIGVPVKVGRTGITEIVQLELNKEENESFLSSVKTVSELIQKLGE
ncbi:MAG: malate dehydrogenase, partial [Candidatus Omnitrophica bacterium]|nr:malate dehydrogenase [Candidatus Omnitrophota bacterium]